MLKWSQQNSTGKSIIITNKKYVQKQSSYQKHKRYIYYKLHVVLHRVTQEQPVVILYPQASYLHHYPIASRYAFIDILPYLLSNPMSLGLVAEEQSLLFVGPFPFALLYQQPFHYDTAAGMGSLLAGLH